MATTTNYGWTTPDDTALVKDGAAAIRTLGSSVDTTTKALNPSTTLGDIEYRSSTANTNTRLGIGSTGQVLTVAGGVPSWAAPGSAINAASNTVSAEETTTSDSFGNLTTAGPAVTITTGTKVLVLTTAYIYTASASAGTMDFDISGATTRSATAATRLAGTNDNIGSSNGTRSTAVTFLTVTAGSNTFTAKYFKRGTSATFDNRSITVIDLGS